MSVTAYIYREERKDPRYPVGREAEAYTVGGFPVEIYVRDISIGGFCFSSSFAFRVGETLKVRFIDDTLTARVARHVQGSTACVFERPLTEDELEGVYARRHAPGKPFRLPLLWRIVVIVGTTLMLWALLAATSFLGMKLVKRVLH